MNPKKFQIPIFIACVFIGILAYNIWVPTPEWIREHGSYDYWGNRTAYQFFGCLVALFFGGMSYIGLYELVDAFLVKDEHKEKGVSTSNESA